MKNAKFYAYRNLHKDCISIKHRGRVVERTTYKKLVGVHFKVSESGRQRVLETKHKNVHAQLAATSIDDYLIGDTVDAVLVEISYNPYKSGNFFNVETGEEVVYAKEAFILGTKVFCREGDIRYKEKQLDLTL